MKRRAALIVLRLTDSIFRWAYPLAHPDHASRFDTFMERIRKANAEA